MLWGFKALVLLPFWVLMIRRLAFPLSLLFGAIVDEVWKIRINLFEILCPKVCLGWWLLKVSWKWFGIWWWEKGKDWSFYFCFNEGLVGFWRENWEKDKVFKISWNLNASFEFLSFLNSFVWIKYLNSFIFFKFIGWVKW